MFKPTSTAISKGISSGLRLGLMVLIGFIFLEYPPLLSLFLSCIAGASVGTIVAWWETEDEFQPIVTTDDLDSEESTSFMGKLRLQSQQKSRRSRSRKKRHTGLFGWITGRGNR